MSSENLFIAASRNKVRFDTVQGQLSIEDLWDLPLQTTRSGRACLDTIAIELDQRLKNAGTTSFVNDAPVGNDELKMKFDIVLHVIEVRKAENKAVEVLRANAERKQKILSLIANKEDEALASQSVDELRELVSTL
jgi:hypothetical protein